MLLYLTVSNILFFSVPTATLSTTQWSSPGNGAPQRGPGPWDPSARQRGGVVCDLHILHSLLEQAVPWVIGVFNWCIRTTQAF